MIGGVKVKDVKEKRRRKRGEKNQRFNLEIGGKREGFFNFLLIFLSNNTKEGLFKKEIRKK